MTVQLATGNTGKAVTSASDRRLYAGMFGTECYVHEIGKMCTASLDGPNKLVVQNGSLMINGAHVDLLGNTEFTIPVGLQAQKRATLCGVLYTASADGHEEAAQKTYTGEAVSDGEVPDPEYPDNNLLDGGVTETFMPLYRVVTDGINTLDPEPLFKVVMPYSKFRDSQSQPKLKTAYATVYIPCYMFAKTRVTAPIFEGYRFVTWLGAGGEGFAVALSFWDMASSSTDVFIAGTTTTDGQTRRMWVYALYEKI